MENFETPKTFTELMAHKNSGGIVKVADKLVLNIKPAHRGDKTKALLLFYNNTTATILLSKIKMLPAPVGPGAFLVQKSHGMIYEILSANAKNKTYICRLVFTPENYPFQKYEPGSKAHLGFWMVGPRYNVLKSINNK